MFSRSGSQSEGDQPVGIPAPTDPTRSDAERAFDQVLSELQPPGAPPTDPDPQTAAASASEHAATLRATRDAHQEAQEMLTLAAETRRQATDEAERIVLEARDAAERTRQELAGWAAAQRAKVDALAADMVESANRDADAIRAEALRTSMAEAEETARAYVVEAAEKADQDAETIRGEARHVLNRANELGAQAAEAISDLTSTVSDIVERLRLTRAAMADLLAENPPAPGADLEGSELSDAIAEEPVGGEAPREDETGDQVGAEDLDAHEDAGLDVVTGPSPDDEDPATLDQQEPVEVPADRQLGSLFRRHGHRGE